MLKETPEKIMRVCHVPQTIKAMKSEVSSQIQAKRTAF